jgi:heptaprenyl diphosphate synthase
MDSLAPVAHKLTHHEMIKAYTSLPEFPEIRVNLLRLFLKYGVKFSLPAPVKESIALAVSLVQLGLDTHDGVDSIVSGRKRQMNVLAGDYCSSRFYEVLAQTEQISSIQLLSHSICEVNRMKMDMYMRAQRLLLSAEDYFTSVVEIKTRLFNIFAIWFDEVYHVQSSRAFRLVTECELILREMQQANQIQERNCWTYWFLLQKIGRDEMEGLTVGTLDDSKLQALALKYNVSGKLFSMWEEKVKELRQFMTQPMGAELFMSEMSRLVEPLIMLRQPIPLLEEM